MMPGITACERCPLGRASRPCPFLPRRYAAGDTIHGEDADAESVRFVKRGTVLLVRSTRSGNDVVRDVVHPGSLIGVEALVRPRYADAARAMTAATLCEVSTDRLRDWLGPEGNPAHVVMTLLASSVPEPRSAGSDGNAVSRTATWILEHDPQELPRRVTAALLGIAPETLSRAIAALKRSGAIAATRTRIAILDRPLLERMASIARRDHRQEELVDDRIA